MSKQNEKMSDLADAVSKYNNAVKHISMLAEKLMNNDLELDVEIILREAVPHHHHNKFQKNNAGHGFDPENLVASIFSAQNMNWNATPQCQPKAEKIGLRQDNMPREIALIMLDSINNWYKKRLEECKRELFQLIKLMEEEDVNRELSKQLKLI